VQALSQFSPLTPPVVPAPAKPVLFFDGECGLCNRIVRLLLRMDRRGGLQFAPLQGPTAQAYLRAHGLPTEDFDSLVFVPDWARRERAEFLLRTEGALAAARSVGGVGRALAWARVRPVSWRDAGYQLIARFRYRIWGEWKPRALARAEWAARFMP
jgi:predicted DCC family thiol-disulfide oxidoreductase YuxK